MTSEQHIQPGQSLTSPYTEPNPNHGIFGEYGFSFFPPCLRVFTIVTEARTQPKIHGGSAEFLSIMTIYSTSKKGDSAQVEVSS